VTDAALLILVSRETSRYRGRLGRVDERPIDPGHDRSSPGRRACRRLAGRRLGAEARAAHACEPSRPEGAGARFHV